MRRTLNKFQNYAKYYGGLEGGGYGKWPLGKNGAQGPKNAFF